MTKRQYNLTGGTAPLLDPASFKRTLSVECRRCERTGDHLALLLIEFTGLTTALSPEEIEDLGSVVASAVRETDLAGWHRDRSRIGVILTAINGTGSETLESVVIRRIRESLLMVLEPAQAQVVTISCHVFPEDGVPGPGSGRAFGERPEKSPRDRMPALLKRSLDVAGSVAALTLLGPLFLLICALVKFSSPGPVLFRQTRIGLGGRKFTFLKFRSMYANSDSAIHEEYIRKLIRQNADAAAGTYKITSDSRVTPVGRLLRKTSLDELPQFINVLRGDMSLVGPRPPIPYEIQHYAVWHRRRIMEAKPGITGQWQVYGRSRTNFDEMVRMDLRYIRNQSFWLDLKILLKTPFAVLSGDGAY